MRTAKIYASNIILVKLQFFFFSFILLLKKKFEKKDKFFKQVLKQIIYSVYGKGLYKYYNCEIILLA